MWILSLEWLLFAMLVFWVTGAVKRLKRLRGAAKQAFQPVGEQLVQLIDLLRSCARIQALKDKVSGGVVPGAHHALLPSADLLEKALAQAQQQPLRAETMAALEAAWQGAQVTWQAYAQMALGSVADPDAQVQEWVQRWQHLATLHQHNAAQFNSAVNMYNRAIRQFPACVVAKLGGLKAGRTFQKDAALQMQPSA